MDFIKKFPALSSCDTILIIINQLFKQAIFIQTINAITSYELAKLFIIHIFSKYSILFHITSNYGSKFVLNFFRLLGTALDISLYFTSRYYPERDS